MNNVLELKGKRFVQAAKTTGGGGPAMNSKVVVTTQQISNLITKLDDIKEFWKNENTPFDGVLISVHYNKIVAKTNRISGIFKGDKSNYSIVGAKFNEEKNKHIITYHLDVKDLDKSILLLINSQHIMQRFFQTGITKTIFENQNFFKKINFDEFSLSKSTFKQVIADVSYIENFEVERAPQQFKESIITLYDIGMDTKQLFKGIVLIFCQLV